MSSEYLEAEQSILGGMLLDQEAFSKGLKLLDPDHFSSESHRRIFISFIELSEQGIPVDLVTLTFTLQKKGELEGVGGSAYLGYLMEFVPTAANIAYYCRLVASAAIQRWKKTLAKQIMASADDEGGEFSRLVTEATAGPPARLAVGETNMILENSLHLQSCEHELPPFDCVLPGMLTGTVGAIVAPGSVGKSMLALEVAIALSAGVDIAGIWGDAQQITKGSVLYLPAEDPGQVVLHRVRAMLSHISSERRVDMFKRLTISPMLGSGVDLMDVNWQAILERAAVGQRLVILDTLNRYHNLDENSAGDMSQLLRVLERIAAATGTSMLFLHHTSKAATWTDSGDSQNASRGSSVLVDNPRWQCNLVGMTKKDAERLGVEEAVRKNFLRLVISKINYGPLIPDRWLCRSEGGVLVSVPKWAMASKPHFKTNQKKQEGMAEHGACPF